MCTCDRELSYRESEREREIADVSVGVVSGNRYVIGPRESYANFEKSPVRITNIDSHGMAPGTFTLYTNLS